MAISLSERVMATGFFVNQQSVQGLGRVDAGNTAAAADDLGTIFFNPAGLIEIWRDPQQRRKPRMAFGTHLIAPGSTQQNRGSAAAAPGTLGGFVPIAGGNAHDPTDPTPVPNFYFGAPVGDRAAIGVGVNFPFGLATHFPADWHGRYDAIDASLRTYNFSVVGAYRLTPRLSAGGGLDIQHARTSLTSAIPSPLVPGGPTADTDARIETTGHANTPGFNVGLLYTFDEHTRVGVHYRSGMKHAIEGTSEVTGLAAPLATFNGTLPARAELNLPAITTAGVRTMVGRDLALLGEFEWFDWSTFKEVRIQFGDGRPDAVRPANYRDAYAVAVGAEFTVDRRWIARGGVHFDTTPTVDGFRDTTVPDSGRVWLGLGASVRASNQIGFDFAFNHVAFADTGVAVTRTFFDNTPLATTAVIDNSVSSVVNTVSVGLRYSF